MNLLNRISPWLLAAIAGVGLLLYIFIPSGPDVTPVLHHASNGAGILTFAALAVIGLKLFHKNK